MPDSSVCQNNNWPRAFAYHTDIQARCRCPHSVLVFPILLSHLVWVRHPMRGWEVPGGKIEPGESAETAARREAFEEAGLKLSDLTWAAEYQIHASGEQAAKWVYITYVKDVSRRPANSEIIDVRLFRPVVSPAKAQIRDDISPIMKDDVYMNVWPSIQQFLQVKGV